MRGEYFIVLLVFVFGFSEVLSVSKEHIKKKTLLKLRTDIHSNETVHSADSINSNGTEPEVAAEKESTGHNGENNTNSNRDNLSSVEEDVAPSSFDENENTGLTSTTFKAKMRSLLKRVFDIFGWSASSAKKRKDRFLESSTANSIRNFRYKDEMRATMGAMLGEKECYKRAVCKAGRYLKDVKGKEMIIVILEKAVPETWSETVSMLKESAIYKDPCHYKCLDD